MSLDQTVMHSNQTNNAHASVEDIAIAILEHVVTFDVDVFTG